MSSPLIVECKEILDGASFKSEVKDENLNEGVAKKRVERKNRQNNLAAKAWRISLHASLSA
jgi:PQQ enzyme repeat domain protein